MHETTEDRGGHQNNTQVYSKNIVTCVLKDGIGEPEKTAVAKQWLYKHVSTAANSCDRSKGYGCNNSGTVAGSVHCGVRACSACKTSFSVPLVNFRGAHRSASYT
jgi:hypothetical protein